MHEEETRLSELEKYQFLDAPSDEYLDNLTKFVGQICEVSAAMISLVGKDRQWAKSIYGNSIYEETAREMSFCEHAIGGDEIYEVNDTLEHDLFSENPLVTDAPQIRFYAGAPLITTAGYKIGTLCVLDTEPRQLNSEQRDALCGMSHQIMHHLELRRKLDVLTKSQSQLSDLVDNTSDLIQSVSPEGKILFVNRTWLETLGYTREELPSLNIFELIHPDCQEHCGNIFQRLMNGIDVGLVEVVFQTKDGRRIPLEGRITVRHQHGEAVATRAIFRDVTERKKAQLELEASESSFRSLVDNIPGAVYRCSNDLNWEIFYVSPAIEEITGYAAAEFTNRERNFASIVHKGDLDYVRKEGADLMRRQQSFTLEYRLVRKDGSICWVYEQGKKSQSNDREIEGTLFDITQRKLAEQKEAEARKDAEAANAAKVNFLSRMSHELRTPLNSIIGFSKLMEMGALSEKHASNAKRIGHAGTHLLNLINEVLEYTTIEANEVYLSIKSVEIEPIINEVIALVAPLAEEREIEIILHSKGPMNARALVDRQHCFQALLNVVSNAIKYNRQHGTVSILSSTTSSGRICIEVKDNGFGISQDKLCRLFTPLDRLDADVNHPEIQGTGLGLSITKKLVQAVGGEISVHSEEGVGSSFTMMFDQVQGDHPSAEQSNEIQKQDAALKQSPPMGGGVHTLKVLYVEDNQDNVALVEQIIEFREGVTLIVAIQGGQGIDLALQHRPDIIFLDYHLPDINGDEVLRRLRGDERTRSIPIYMVSADAMPEQVKRLKELGVQGYLTKPLDVERFLAVIDEKLLEG
ncbi:PAS domain S-box protein [Verrucomicrobia bacterium]|nr:PAS domain S-box protein [Verrucomicrobiota bacterium]